jgi:uncharacterized protein (TIGR00251 family)
MDASPVLDDLLAHAGRSLASFAAQHTEPGLKVKIGIKVVPGASRDSIDGWLGDDVKMRVRAPAERGRANKAVLALLAEALGLPRKSVKIITGDTAQRKIVEITGLSEAEVHDRLKAAASS